jgi:hypothetical protein
MSRATKSATALTAGLLFGLAAVPLLPAGADAPSEYGYWSKAQTPGSPNPSIPVPPTVPVPPPEQVVPAGGMYVALASNTSTPDPTQVPSPTEPAAVSALRFYVTPGSEVTLSLSVADGQDVDGPPQANHPPYVVDACTVDTQALPWDPPDGAGRWEDRPVWDCDSSSTPSVVEEDGQRLSWELGTAFEAQEGIIDVVLVPRGVQDPNDPTKVDPIPFQLGFAPPDDQALLILNAPVEEDPTVDNTGGDDFAFDGFGTDTTSFDETGFGGDTGTTDGGSTQTTLGKRPNLPFRPIAQAPLPLDNRFDRILAVSLLFAIGLGLWWIGGSPARPPRLLGSLGGGVPTAIDRTTLGGVGRFSRPRSGRPPKL